VSSDVEGVRGNREVPPPVIRDPHDNLTSVRVVAHREKEGGSWGKHGFPHATEAKPREVAA
jgi:hypothetical protein